MIHEDKKGIRVVDIARRINISPPSVTEALSKLEKKGYVKKIEGEDRREKILSITKKGEERMKKFTEFMRLEMKEKMSVLTDDDKKKLEKSLSNIVNILHKVK
jgi:DNA-binding MarR family transcriptional regulator